MTTTTSTSPTQTSSALVTPARVAIGAAVGLVLNLIALWIGSASGASLETDAPEPINALTVAITSVLPVVLGALVVARVARHRPGFQHVAAWAGSAFAILTAAMPFVVSDDLATALTLASMHVVISVVWFATIRPTPTR